MELAAGSVVADRFVVEARLGRGGMAVVYRVRHRTLGTPFALKVLATTSTSAAARLRDEGRHQARLRHPNVVGVHDLVEVGGAPALVLELVDGPPLSSLLGGAPLLVDPIDALGAGILAGVAAAHRLGLVHRDLKPGNVLLAVVDGRVVPKVSDFGIARLLGDETADRRTLTGAALGTPHYMAPEQVRDAKGVDARADVWALGVMLHELAAGSPPFDGSDRLELFQAIARGEHRPLRELRPDLPPRMLRAVAAALQVDPGRRPPDAQALLDLWLDGRPAIEDPGGLAARVQAITPRPDPLTSSGSASTWGDAPHTAPVTAAAAAAPRAAPPRWLGIAALVVLLLIGGAALALARLRAVDAPPAIVTPAPPPAALAKAWEALLDARFDVAVREAEFRAAGQEDAEAQRMLAVASFALGRRYSALEELEKGTRRARGADAATAMLDGVVDPARLDRWIAANPDDLLARVWRVQVAPTWEPGVARAHAEAVARGLPDRALGAYVVARAARLAGRSDAAAEAVARWAAAAPDEAEPRLEAASLLLATGRAEDASALLEALPADLGRTDVWALRVRADHARGDAQAVERDRAQGTRLPIDPKIRFHYAYADALLASGATGEAWAELEAADLACRGYRDPLVHWFCVELSAETARLAFHAGDAERVALAVERLRAPIDVPSWAAEVAPARLRAAEGLLALLAGRRDEAVAALEQLRRDGAPPWMVHPLEDALARGAAAPPRVRPDLLP